VVDGNTLSNLAMSTRDMGGLSFIGEGHTGTVVRNNCVRNVIGMDTDSTGHFLRPFYTWGLYLDNWSSNFTVTGNVIRGNVLGGVFVHGGSNNTISNNVLYNSSNASMPTEGHYPAGGLGVTFGYMHVSSGSSLENNHVTQNIIVGPASGPANPGGTHGPTQIVLTIQPNFTKFASGLTVERNLYFQPGVRLESTVHLTPLGGWAAWRSSGYDTKSVIDVDPLFVGASTGDFRLARGSMALAMGFVPLDNPQC
jgi:parallel beta-helix repeat protein